MMHKVLHYSFVLLALFMVGILVRYSIFENYAATVRNKAAQNTAALLAVSTTNAADTLSQSPRNKGTVINKSEESFQATLSTSTFATPSAFFKITPDEKSIVYYIHEELGTSSAKLFCVTGSLSGFTISALNSAGTLTNTDLVPLYSQNCTPEIRIFADLIKAIRAGKVYFVLGELRAQLIPVVAN